MTTLERKTSCNHLDSWMLPSCGQTSDCSKKNISYILMNVGYIMDIHVAMPVEALKSICSHSALFCH